MNSKDFLDKWKWAITFAPCTLEEYEADLKNCIKHESKLFNQTPSPVTKTKEQCLADVLGMPLENLNGVSKIYTPAVLEAMQLYHDSHPQPVVTDEDREAAASKWLKETTSIRSF